MKRPSLRAEEIARAHAPRSHGVSLPTSASGCAVRRPSGRQIGREGLGRRQQLARDAALRDRALLDRQEGLAGVALEHKDQPLRGARDDDIAFLAVEGVIVARLGWAGMS